MTPPHTPPFDSDRHSSRARRSVRARVLIMTGDPQRAATWLAALRRKHYAVAIATSDLTVSTLVAERVPDVLILDLADAANDRLELCRRLRADRHTVPVIMLHPLATPEDLRAGLDAGADVYLRGWLEPEERLVHLRTLCPQQAAQPSEKKRTA